MCYVMRYITVSITLYNSYVMRKENGMGEENLNCQIRRSDKYSDNCITEEERKELLQGFIDKRISRMEG